MCGTSVAFDELVVAPNTTVVWGVVVGGRVVVVGGGRVVVVSCMVVKGGALAAFDVTGEKREKRLKYLGNICNDL